MYLGTWVFSFVVIIGTRLGDKVYVNLKDNFLINRNMVDY